MNYEYNEHESIGGLHARKPVNPGQPRKEYSEADHKSSGKNAGHYLY